MNKIALVIVSIFFVFAFAGITFTAEKRMDIKMAAGEVKAIDIKAKTLTIRDNKKGDFACIFDDKTVVRMNHQIKNTLADIKVGDVAALIYEEFNGKNIVKSITVLSPAGPSSSENKMKTSSPEGKK